jgi:glucose/arabinose dehydrogenase
MRAMLRRFTLLICLLALAAPFAAQAQDSPFAPLPQAAPQQQQTTTSSTSSSDDGGLEAWQQILIFAAGGILLLGIAWAIVKDARSVAPAGDDSDELVESKARKEADLKRRKAKNRETAKRARAARKKNR